MATQLLVSQIQLKRGLAEAWDRNNPILAQGEPGWTLDTHILKIGDGVTPWKTLPSIQGANIDPSKDSYTRQEIDQIIAQTKGSLIRQIEIEEERAKIAEQRNSDSIASILNENTGILAQAKAYTDGALIAASFLKIDDDTIKIKDNKAYIAKVSTDVLEQGEKGLILCAGSSNI